MSKPDVQRYLDLANDDFNSLSTQEMAALRAYVALLQSRFKEQLVELLLFGSKARGDAQAGSDIDVLVVLANPDAQALSDARALGFDILLTHQVFLSIRAMSYQQWQDLEAMNSLFYRNLMKDGISLLPDLSTSELIVSKVIRKQNGQ